MVSAFVADVGGTHLRYALCTPGGPPGDPVVLAGDDHPGLAQALLAAAAALGVEPGALDAGAVAVAGPVGGDRVTLTNRGWDFSIDDLRQRLGLERLVVVNDLTALAASLPHLGADEVEHFGGGEPASGGALAVLAAGTGLGVSGLLASPSGWLPISGEGGHVDFAPANDREIEMLRLLRRSFGHVSVERLLSGPGLVNLYHVAAAIDDVTPALEDADLTPAAVAQAAIAGSCAVAKAAAQAFSEILGAVAGDLALMLGASGGVYIGGGATAGLGSAFARDAFRRRFEDKGRFARYLAAIPSYLIAAAHPALRGLAELLAETPGPGRRAGT